jgi:hypothetical protein
VWHVEGDRASVRGVPLCSMTPRSGTVCSAPVRWRWCLGLRLSVWRTACRHRMQRLLRVALFQCRTCHHPRRADEIENSRPLPDDAEYWRALMSGDVRTLLPTPMHADPHIPSSDVVDDLPPSPWRCHAQGSKRPSVSGWRRGWSACYAKEGRLEILASHASLASCCSSMRCAWSASRSTQRLRWADRRPTAVRGRLARGWGAEPAGVRDIALRAGGLATRMCGILVVTATTVGAARGGATVRRACTRYIYKRTAGRGGVYGNYLVQLARRSRPVGEWSDRAPPPPRAQVGLIGAFRCPTAGAQWRAAGPRRVLHRVACTPAI